MKAPLFVMLIFCNNFLSSQTFLFDNQRGEYYLTIHKNGSSSLERLAADNPTRYSLHNTEFLKKNKVDRVVVFVRNPIKRVISGLATQMVTYGISQQAIEKMTNNTFGIIDSHTIPQFWFLMAAAKELDCKFDIRPMDMLNLVDCNIQQLNKSPFHNIGLSDATLTQLNHFYTEDIVLFNQFQNSTATIEEIRTKILLEKNFIDDLNQYKECLTFYFETQLH